MSVQPVPPGISGAPQDQICPMCFASHGCDLAPGHKGDHECHHEDPGEEPQVFSWPQGQENEFDWRRPR